MNQPNLSGDDLYSKLANDSSGEYAEQTRQQLEDRAQHFQSVATQESAEELRRQAIQISDMFATAAQVVGKLARQARM